MGLDLIQNIPLAQERYHQANDILGWSVEKLSTSDDENFSLKQTLYAQPAIYTHSCVVHEILAEAGLFPTFTAGHSAGEYAALTAAKAWDFATGLRVIAERARFMSQAKHAGSMAAVLGVDAKIITEVVSGWTDGILVVANYNSPKQTVISGDVEAIDQVIPVLKEKKARRVLKLPVSGAFHSPLMKKAQQAFDAFMQTVEIKSPTILWGSNNSALIETDAATIRSQLVKQFCEPVRWVELMELVSRQCDSCIEVGPGEVLRGLAKACCEDLECGSAGSLEGIEKVKENYVISS